MNTQQLVENLLSASKHHDWFYQYSDDYSVWRAGNRQHSTMNDAFHALHKVDPDLAIDTWNSLAPEGMRYLKASKD